MGGRSPRRGQGTPRSPPWGGSQRVSEQSWGLQGRRGGEGLHVPPTSSLPSSPASGLPSTKLIPRAEADSIGAGPHPRLPTSRLLPARTPFSGSSGGPKAAEEAHSAPGGAGGAGSSGQHTSPLSGHSPREFGSLTTGFSSSQRNSKFLGSGTGGQMKVWGLSPPLIGNTTES